MEAEAERTGVVASRLLDDVQAGEWPAATHAKPSRGPHGSGTA